MDTWTNKPNIYEINTRVWLKELTESLEKNIDLSNVPEDILKSFSDAGFNALWLMGVWKPSVIGREVAKNHEGLKNEFLGALPDLKESDILASPYAVGDYTVSDALGGDEGLKKFRKSAEKYNLKIILDFVPNHTGMDFPWVTEHPDYYIQGTVEDFQRDPHTFFNAGSNKNPIILAHGKDPYFPAWTDTAQLNYFNPDLRKAQIKLLNHLADICDGIRCDMAMLMMNEIHIQVWGDRLFGAKNSVIPNEFWAEAIKEVKTTHKNFLFIAESYWMKEGLLQQLGFDYTYDKALYDWLKEDDINSIKNYVSSFYDYQKKCIRFIENHDEPRAANTFSIEQNKTSALITSTLPGAMLWHEGQLEGFKVRCPVQLGRRRKEAVNTELKSYYTKLLDTLKSDAFHKGDWLNYQPLMAWEGNYSNNNFLIWSWQSGKEFYLAVANLSPFRSQCYVKLQEESIHNGINTLTDSLSSDVYERSGTELCDKGLYLDIEPWHRHLFKIS